MTIRWTTTDRSTGQKVVLENPTPREFVKDGVRKSIGPKRDDVEGLKMRLKQHSPLGLRGGILA